MKNTDPLAAAWLYLRLNPKDEENRALRMLLRYLINFDGTLYASESILFKGELGELTAALIDARTQGRYSVDEWQEAQCR